MAWQSRPVSSPLKRNIISVIALRRLLMNNALKMRVKAKRKYPFAKKQFFENSQCPIFKLRVFYMQEQAHVSLI